MKIIKFLKIITINFFIFFILLFFIEIFTGSYFKESKINCMYVGCNLEETYYHDLYSDEKINTKYTKGKYGFRNRVKKPSDLDILVIGGSTADSRYIDDKYTWPNLLEKKLSNELKLNIDVVNSAIDGQTTFGHIYNFENWYRYIDNLRPKIILFYIGINDSYLFSNEKLSKERAYDRPTEIVLFTKKYFVNNSNFLYPIYKILKGIWISRKFEAGHMKTLLFKKKKILFVKSDESKESTNFHLKKFQERLLKLTNLTIDLGAIPIFVTQKSMYWEKKGKEIYATDENIGMTAYHQDIISQSIIKYSLENNLKYIDTSNYDFKYDHFYDYNHFNQLGSKFFSNLIYKDLLKIIKKNQISF